MTRLIDLVQNNAVIYREILQSTEPSGCKFYMVTRVLDYKSSVHDLLHWVGMYTVYPSGT